MTTFIHSPSISPKSFTLPTTRSHRGAASSSPGGGTSPFSRPLRRSSPRPSPPLYGLGRDALPATRANLASSSGAVPSAARASAIRSAAPTDQVSASVLQPGTESKNTQTTPTLQHTPDISSGGMRDAGTQYTPDGLPPTAPSPQVTRISSLSEQAQEMARSRGSSGTLASSSSGDVFMTDVAPSAETSGTPLRNVQSTSIVHLARGPGESGPVIDSTVTPGLGTGESSSQGARAIKRPDTASEGSEKSQGSVVNMVPSSPKRSRTDVAAPKVMPKDYMDCDLRELGIIISDMLMELIRLNDQIPPREGSLTRFHSRAPPTISVRDYLNRLIVHATISAPLLLTIVFYIDRLCTMYPAFTITSLTVHRFLITAATVAAKGLSDSFWTNHTYARVGGVSTKELAMLELDFLGRLDWTIVPNPDTLEDYYRSLIGRAEGHILEGSADEGLVADIVSSTSQDSDPLTAPGPADAQGIHFME